eukprot:5931154-Pyramimonas_sp.AAC.1
MPKSSTRYWRRPLGSAEPLPTALSKRCEDAFTRACTRAGTHGQRARISCWVAGAPWRSF